MIVCDNASKEVLMFAWMNAEALEKTQSSGLAHFYSRSRGKLWLKGETSGETFAVDEIRVDCDQDVLQLRVTAQGKGVACHTGRRSCFYRKLENNVAFHHYERLASHFAATHTARYGQDFTVAAIRVQMA